MKTVYINGTKIKPTQRDFLGSGGEGSVFKIKLNGKKSALKIYTTPDIFRSDKLKAYEKLSPSFNDRVIAPELLALDSRGLAVGFTMPLVTGSFEEVAFLANKKYRNDFGITTKDVVETFLDGLPTLELLIHRQGFVVGDLNDLNELINKKRMIWIDVDSWQFGKFACQVATENFLDPRLYGVDLSKKAAFTPGNDWYSFAVMLFRSLLLVHPFGGTHKDFNRVVTRAMNKIPVYDPEVIYPKIAFSPDILTDDLHNIFDQYFTKGFRKPFPEVPLREYLTDLRACTSCGGYFPTSRGSCPICSAKAMVIIQKPVKSTKNITVTEVIRTNGQILFARVVEDEIRVLANENGKIVYYVKRESLPVLTKQMFDFVPGMRFEMTSDNLLVNKPNSSSVYVYDLATTNLLGKVTTDTFIPTRKAIFRASNDHFYRIDGSDLNIGKLVDGRFEEKVLRQVVQNQTWFWANSHSDEPFVFGLFQVIRQQVYWMIKDGLYFDVNLPPLETNEVLLDISVKFSSQGVYVLRKTQNGGINFLRQELVNNKGNVISSNKLEESNHPYPKTHGQVYSTGIVLHPTDAGVIQEEVKSGKTKAFPDTDKFVDSSNALVRFGSSLLSIKSDRIIQISTK